MSATSTCPLQALLQEYLLGSTSDATADSMEAHLASCPDCRKRLQTIHAEDDFVADFRALAHRPRPKNPLLDQLAADLHGMIPRLRIAPDATPSADAEATPAPNGGSEDEADDVRSRLAPPQQPDEMGRLGDYRVLKVLGSGGMGVVFLAEDVRLRRLVALKAMKPGLAANVKARQRFLREAQLTASLTHDHIVAIHQIGEEKGLPFLAMPLLQGESLDARLKREKTLPTAEVLRIGRETAEGLAAAHERGLIHRDVKPANLWLETMPGGKTRVKVLDFGLARGGEGQHLTQTGAVLGTPAYMAPEQVEGAVDPRADLFSLGCVLYRMATGQTPFPGETVMQVLAKVAAVQPRPPRELNPQTPPALSDLMLRLLAKDPAHRPQTAGETIEAIQAVERTIAALAKTVVEPSVSAPANATRPATAGGGKRRRPWIMVAVAAGFLAAAVVATVIIIHYKDKDGKPQQIKVELPAGAKDLEVVVRPGDAPTGAPDEITNSIGIKLKLIQPGKFLMGSPKDEEGRNEDEGPQHQVEISRPFYMAVCPVTKGQFAEFAKDADYQTEAETDGTGGYGYNAAMRKYEGRDPKYSWKSTGWEQTDAHPVVNVSWNDAVLFCTWLSRKEGKTYELPTEAEWEYACRAGTTTRYWCGYPDASLRGNANVLDASLKSKIDSDLNKGWAYQSWDDGYPFTSPVGMFKANPWGLYDMHGNVFQWCADRYGKYQEGSSRDPKGPDDGPSRVLRGGGWGSTPWLCRAAHRQGWDAGLRDGANGFRVVMRPAAGTP